MQQDLTHKGEAQENETHTFRCQNKWSLIVHIKPPICRAPNLSNLHFPKANHQHTIQCKQTIHCLRCQQERAHKTAPKGRHTITTFSKNVQHAPEVRSGGSSDRTFFRHFFDNFVDKFSTFFDSFRHFCDVFATFFDICSTFVQHFDISDIFSTFFRHFQVPQNPTRSFQIFRHFFDNFSDNFSDNFCHNLSKMSEKCPKNVQANLGGISRARFCAISCSESNSLFEFLAAPTPAKTQRVEGGLVRAGPGQTKT